MLLQLLCVVTFAQSSMVHEELHRLVSRRTCHVGNFGQHQRGSCCALSSRCCDVNCTIVGRFCGRYGSLCCCALGRGDRAAYSCCCGSHLVRLSSCACGGASAHIACEECGAEEVLWSCGSSSVVIHTTIRLRIVHEHTLVQTTGFQTLFIRRHDSTI